MKSLLIGVCGIIFGLSLVFPMSGIASDHDSKNKIDKSQQQKLRATNHLPIYKPPLRGAPAGRVSGGTRGAGQELPYLCLIVPDHIGLTLSSRPTLYFYQSKPSSFPIEFTLIEKQGITPIVETQISPLKISGIQSVRLSDFNVSLEQGKEYKWFVALIPNPQNRSKDILAAGGIECVKDTGKIKDKLAAAGFSHAPHIYADAGLWYDAYDAISDLIETSPNDVELKKYRAALLEQIGLAQVVNHGNAE